MRILIVDDRSNDAEMVSMVLRNKLEQAEVTIAADAVDYAERLAEGDFDLVISERRLAWGDGLRVLESVKRRNPSCPVIFLTTVSDQTNAFEATKRGVDAYLIKGSSGFLQLPEAVRWAVQKKTDAKRADALLFRLPIGVFSLSAYGEMRCLNPACRNIFRLPEDGGPDTLRIAELLDAAGSEQLRQVLVRHQALSEFDARLANGEPHAAWVRLLLWPVDQEGGHIAYEGAVTEVTTFKAEVAKLSTSAEELGRSNAQLEKFAYVVSHDLQEPLSYILRYGRLVRERYSGQLDAEADRYLGHIADSAGRLQTMIDDILAYSRINTRGEDFRAVDLGTLADAAAASLKGLFEETRAVYQRGPLPTLEVDAAQVQQLFQNLFSNALKFRGAPPPRIEVTAQQDPNGWRFCVVDNGIGIAPEDRERVFGMFQRLHGSDEYPGTGIGLAICRGIVERHGGAIWIDAAAGQGSAFCFRLPAAAAPRSL